MTTLLLLLFSSLCFFHCTFCSSSSKHIAIVGAGAGGTSAAYFAHEQFPDAHITIFEQNDYVGGRVLSMDFVDTHIEVGASSVHNLNTFLVNFGKKFDVKALFDSESPDKAAIWDGKQFVWEEGSSWITTTLSVLWRYGLSPHWVSQASKKWIDKWMKIYSDNEPWHSIEEFLDRYQMRETMNKSFTNSLITDAGSSPLYVDEVITGITRGIYNQNASLLSAIAGYVSLAGTDSEQTFTFSDNGLIFKKLVESSGADLKLNSLVQKISLNKIITEQLDNNVNIQAEGDQYQPVCKTSSTQYTVEWTQNGETQQQIFDAVIIAAPLELTNIEIDGIVGLPVREYRKVYVTLCHGILSKTYFGKDVSTIQLIITTKDVSRWTQFHVLRQFPDGSVIVKFFSIEEISEEELNLIFLTRHKTQVLHWYAYPMLKPTEIFPPVTISTNLFYVNAFESFLSVMEGSVVSSWNIVRLLSEEWKEEEPEL